MILSRPSTPWRRMILLGRQVVTAFGYPAATYFSTWTGGDKRFLLLPHPSGLNRLWNVDDSYGKAMDALRELAPEMPWGKT
jgi:uracil-DNA glycosylase